MSWYVTALGRPGAVKKSLATAFASAKKQTEHIAAESASVGHIESAVNTLLDFSASSGKNAVKVSANGSVSGSHVSANMTYETLSGFVEDDEVPTKQAENLAAAKP